MLDRGKVQRFAADFQSPGRIVFAAQNSLQD
jgi:hypothetical protein